MNRALSGRLQRAAYRGGGSARMRRFARLRRRLAWLRNPRRRTATEIALVELSVRMRQATGPPPSLDVDYLRDLSAFCRAYVAAYFPQRY